VNSMMCGVSARRAATRILICSMPSSKKPSMTLDHLDS
jgi:hypothetical protein